MNAEIPFKLLGRLIAIGPNKLAKSIPLSFRTKPESDWIVGSVAATDDKSVHADYWERHPTGDEVLYLFEGHIEIIVCMEDAPETRVGIQSGDAFIVPKGAWHRLRVVETSRLLYVTPGGRAEHRRHDSQ